MPELPMGANTALGSRHGDVVISHALDPALDVNLTAFLVGADGRVRSDADMLVGEMPNARLVDAISILEWRRASTNATASRSRSGPITSPKRVESSHQPITLTRYRGFTSACVARR